VVFRVGLKNTKGQRGIKSGGIGKEWQRHHDDGVLNVRPQKHNLVRGGGTFTRWGGGEKRGEALREESVGGGSSGQS